LQEDRPGLAVAAGGDDVPQLMPRVPQIPVARQQQPMAAPEPRMPGAAPPRMAEPRMPGAAAPVVRPLGAEGELAAY